MMKQVTGIQESVQAERAEPCLSVISADRSVPGVLGERKEKIRQHRVLFQYFLQSGRQQTPGLKGEGVWG